MAFTNSTKFYYFFKQETFDWVYKVDVSKRSFIALAQKQSSELCIYLRLPRLISTNRKAVALSTLFRAQLIVWLTFLLRYQVPWNSLDRYVKVFKWLLSLALSYFFEVNGNAVATLALPLWAVVTLVCVCISVCVYVLTCLFRLLKYE